MTMATITEDYIVKSPFPDITFPKCDLWSYIYKRIKECPSAIAIEDPLENRVITFKELGTLVEKLAEQFVAYGITLENPLVICMSNCIEYVLILLATWKLGGQVSMMSPLLTADEIKPQLKLLSAEYIFCSNQSVRQVIAASHGTNMKKIINQEDHPGCLPFSSFYNFPRVTPRQMPCLKIDPFVTTAVIPFSSGTTGLPKGVEITHSALIEQCEVSGIAIHIQSSENGLVVFQPFSHIFGLGLIMLCFGHGNRVISMQQFDLERYIQLVSINKIDKLFLVPPIIVLLCKSGLVQRYDWSHVKLITSGAAPLSKDIEEELAGILGPDVMITQGYGMTETSNGCIIAPFHPLRKYSHPQGTIGWPISNTVGKVVDEDGKKLSPNKTGEVCVKCSYLMKRYYKNPEATRNTIDSDHWIHTGDVGYYDEHGYFFIVDRIKELIKFKGYQVAPSELESLLLTHPDVADAGVTSIPDLEAGELPHAWVVKKPGVALVEKDLQTFVNARVATFKKLRGGIRFVDNIPKSPSGKILRRVIKKQTILSSKL